MFAVCLVAFDSVRGNYLYLILCLGSLKKDAASCPGVIVIFASQLPRIYAVQQEETSFELVHPSNTVLHRDYFIVETDDSPDSGIPLGKKLTINFALLVVALLAVVLLAKKFSLVVDVVTVKIGAPPAFAGLVVAALILLPESVAAVAAARKNDLQKSINLALGSSIATIGLTVPAVALAAYVLDKQLVLGLSNQHMLILLLTFMVSMLTFGTGRTNILFGLVHMVVFAVFVFMVFVP